MLSKAVNFLKNQVDEFLSYKGEVSQSILRVSSLAGNDKSDNSKDNTNVLNLSIVNIEEEEVMANRMSYTEKDGAFQKTNSPVHLNVYLLFSMSFNDNQYLEGLHWLSLVIQFFQQNKSFTSETTAMPEGITKLNLELVNIEIDNMSRFWGALGANYQPSVIYKMRMITIDGEAFEARVAGVKEPQVKSEASL